MAYTYGEGEIGVFMPAINLDKAKQTAEILKARAGIDCRIVVCLDNDRKGFIAVANHLFKESNYKYVVYTAEDAFPSMNWLKFAYEALETTGKSLLAFNDGKWFGRLAAFGTVRTAWAKTNYASGNLFFEGYKSHYADNELTDNAIRQNSLVFRWECILVEIDFKKRMKWVSDANDRKLYLSREHYLFNK